MSKHEDEVCKKIQARAEVGKAKYGVSMERTDLNIVEWLTHLQEELMDASVYVERLIQDYKKYANRKEIIDLLQELNE
jgi:hypothetical protein|tara:strand:- start:65 stop:298 length:234 start_codon:yes stop_codon:yes gene_type:complete